MKLFLASLVAIVFAGTVKAQVEVLPPDFVLFGKTSSDYAAELYQFVYPLSTNMDPLLPKAGPLNDERVYFLARPIFPGSQPGIPTFVVPDDAYVFLPIYAAVWDNIDTIPPLTIEELRDTARVYVDAVTAVHATIDGVMLTNLLGHRTESAVFSVFFPVTDNFESLIIGHPFVGLDDPMVADGYFLMLKPLSAGLHDFRTGGEIGEPNGFAFERHYQIRSLSLSERLVDQTEKLAAIVINSALPSQRQHPLLVSLKSAKASFISGEPITAVNQLNAFRNKVRAQVAPTYPELAAILAQSAQNIIDKATQ